MSYCELCDYGIFAKAVRAAVEAVGVAIDPKMAVMKSKELEQAVELWGGVTFCMRSARLEAGSSAGQNHKFLLNAGGKLFQ